MPGTLFVPASHCWASAVQAFSFPRDGVEAREALFVGAGTKFVFSSPKLCFCFDEHAFDEHAFDEHALLVARHLFGAVRQRSLFRKWLKNSLRAAVVLFTAAVAMFVGPR